MNLSSNYVSFTLWTFHVIASGVLCYDISAVLDNFIIGTPKVVCGESEVALDIITAKPFIGNIFVKGRAKDTTCRQSFSDPALSNGTNTYILSLGKCGMQRLRSANPRGINFAVTVVVSFHPAGFITKTDRAFHLNCFYTEPDEIVTSSFEVSQLPTQELSDQMRMPSCHYSVHSTSVDGAELSWANVGDVVFHVWECRGPEMGILIKKCFVTDGDGEDHAVVDEDGCSLDHSLLSEVTYDKDGTMRAHAKSQVFKYADSNQLFFTCQIRMCQKQMDMCHGITPPKCEGGQKLGGGKKRKGKKDGKDKKTGHAHSEDEHRLEEAAETVEGELSVDSDDTVPNRTSTVATVRAPETTTVQANETVADSTLAQRKKNQQVQRPAVAEEEEDGDEEGQWVLKRPEMALSRKSRSLTQGQMPTDTGEQLLEVDVASPQMLVLDQEDRARMGPLRRQFASTSASLSANAAQQSAGDIAASDALRRVPLLPDQQQQLCLSRAGLVLLVPVAIALLAGLGSALTLCMLHAFARAARGKRRAHWTSMFF
uniref:ZP domain-containing protein n=1 Tax=Globodera pallida TaxID=36090 RepID=A0A183CPG3_GLOPA